MLRGGPGHCGLVLSNVPKAACTDSAKVGYVLLSFRRLLILVRFQAKRELIVVATMISRMGRNPCVFRSDGVLGMHFTELTHQDLARWEIGLSRWHPCDSVGGSQYYHASVFVSKLNSIRGAFNARVPI
jgi:hypothetical protein